MTRNEYLACMLFVCSITLSFFFGYFMFRYDGFSDSRSNVKIVPEINPKVCTVDIYEISDGFVRGSVGEKQVRLRYKDELYFPDSDGSFEIEFN